MTKVLGTPRKAAMKLRLFEIGVEALEQQGWKVERIPRFGKSSVRRIRKGRESKVVSIRTTQDTWIAFPRNKNDSGWVTLSDVDAVVAVSVDDRENPRFAQVHIVDGDEMRSRFDRAYAVRKAAGHSIPLGRGVWVSLYLPDAEEPVSQVGAGAGLAHPAIARVPLESRGPTGLADTKGTDKVPTGSQPAAGPDGRERPLTINEAKRRLALTLGVDPSNIRITVEA